MAICWEQTYGKAGNYFINAMLKESNDNGFVLVRETDNYSRKRKESIFSKQTDLKKLWENITKK